MKKMKATWLLMLVTIAGIVGCGSTQEATTRQLIAMELDRSKAISSHDTVALDRMYTDDFKGVTAIGFPVTKSILMEVFKRDNPDVIFTNSDHQVRVLNKRTAILTGKLVGKTKENKIIHESVYIHVLIKKEGRWQIAAGQGTMKQ
jgi:hypothetical protein